MYGFGYSLFHQWPRFRLWAQQSDPGQHCRDRRRILQVLPAFAGKPDAANAAVRKSPSLAELRKSAKATVEPVVESVAVAVPSARPAANRVPSQPPSKVRASRHAPVVQRQGRLGCAPGRAERPLPSATRQGQTSSRLSLPGRRLRPSVAASRPLPPAQPVYGWERPRQSTGPSMHPFDAPPSVNATTWRRMAHFVQRHPVTHPPGPCRGRCLYLLIEGLVLAQYVYTMHRLSKVVPPKRES